MFDLIAGPPRHPFHDRTMVPTLVSVVGHGVIILTIATFSLLYAADKLPEIPTMMAFVAAAPPPPPPPPPPAAPKPAAAPAHPAVPTVAPGFAAPVEAPSGIHTELPTPAGAVEGGVEGGVPGGVAGGIVGGLVSVAAPPPPPPPPAPRAQPEPVRIGGAILAPALVHRVEPIYPDIAVAAKVTGIVILEATVDAAGSVGSVRVLRSVKLLDQPAIDAVRQWQYSPLVLNGVPTPFVLTVTLNFSFKT